MSRKFSVKSCGKKHNWCGVCRPELRIKCASGKSTLSLEHRASISRGIKKYVKTPEHREALSRAMKGKPPSPITRAAVSKAKKGKPSPKRAATWARDLNDPDRRDKLIQQLRDARSSREVVSKPQLAFGLLLLGAGYDVYAEIPCGPYSIDWWDPERRIAWEVDGTYWHTNRKEYDARRDGCLTSLGIITIRIDADLDLPSALLKKLA